MQIEHNRDLSKEPASNGIFLTSSKVIALWFGKRISEARLEDFAVFVD